MALLSELLASDFRELDRRASDLYLAAVAQVRPDSLHLPTPCADWTLHGLIRHQVSQDEGFAAAVDGRGADLRVWRNGRLGDDPFGAAKTSLDALLTAFEQDGVLDREFVLPEIRADGTFPARLAISFHFVDLVVHAWDVAATIGAPWEPGRELTDAALKVAGIVPAAPGARGPGESFDQVAGPIDDGVPAEHRLLALLGRSPSWTPPGGGAG
ncbi:TIGR03086 family metal-binding protein [Actinomadura xylanilytica]|uniref:TIGR03086 family metal-binding protein n=1 Tax=Actinomadura xylanilytica TaxID=887459 RepID=UPI00255A8807|nr:TIGR03086 family metal-binding protein [Actinomadura xylanilytica]MDL4771355.1 TIGR03086 family metal-binding protein [Actinomadura xylanilytica]